MQKGSVQVFIILLVLILAVGGIYFYQSNQPKKGINDSRRYITVEQALNLEKYDNQALGFQLTYPKDFIIKEDSEEEYNKRGNGDFRKNFKGYVGYEPGEFLGAVVVLDKDQKYDTNPFTLWVFDNPNNLTIDTWHHDYWYYPFVWGDFTSEGKFDLAPQEIATVSGQTGKSRVIDYQPGKPKFVYIAKDQKMYLFRIIGDEGDKILSTFEFN